MNDAALAKLGEEKLRLEAEKNKAEKAYNETRAKIVAELQRRGVKSITTRGIVLTLSEPETTEYDEVYLEHTLDRKTWISISDRRLNVSKLLSAVSMKKIPARVLKKATSVKPKAPYPTVTREKK